MYFQWLRSQNLGYEMTSAPALTQDTSIKIHVHGYADNMALIGNSNAEVLTIFSMLERFLAYYGMELNAAKCGYQYLTHDPTDIPQSPICKWGKISILHGKNSYKYLGFYINVDLDFAHQHKALDARQTKRGLRPLS